MPPVDKHTISPAGDPFYAASRRDEYLDQDPVHPHGCIAGVVYIGHLVIGEDGEEVEVFEAVPCRRCSR
jgi:hypothetical protein